jgi:hypothetical protein
VLLTEKLKNKHHHLLLKVKEVKVRAKSKNKNSKYQSHRVHKFNNPKTKVNKTNKIYKDKMTKSYKSKLNTLFIKTMIIKIELLHKSLDILMKYKIKYWPSKDKMLKFLLFVQVLFMDAEKILFINFLELLGYKTLPNFLI